MPVPTVKLVDGKTYSVWKENGVFQGQISRREVWKTSERTENQPGGTVLPSESLVCAGPRERSHWPFKRKTDDGEIWVHLNHLCPCQPYYDATPGIQAKRRRCQFHGRP